MRFAMRHLVTSALALCQSFVLGLSGQRRTQHGAKVCRAAGSLHDWPRSRLLRLESTLAIFISCGLASPLLAQRNGRAVTGEPFGVATVTVPLPAGSEEFIRTQAVWVSERDGRTFYPVITHPYRQAGAGPVGRETRELSVSFLFRGSEPLSLTVHTPFPQTLELTPAPAPASVNELLWRRWWTAFEGTAVTAWQRQSLSLLPRVYLTTMLSDRLGFRTNQFGIPETKKSDNALASLAVFFGGQAPEREIVANWLRQSVGGAEISPLDLPQPPAWEPLDYPDVPDAGVEPMALHVPEECFYIRFGSFSNYLWFQRFSAEANDFIGSLANPQGAYVDIGKRIERQLGLETSALAELLGDQLIADAALVGRDLFLQEGAAFGILLQARSSSVLGADLQRQRRSAWQREKARGAAMETVELAGRQVSFLSTPDNRLRSFHAVDGDFHLVTTSRDVAKRFLEAGSGDGVLGKSAAFRHARSELPLDRNDTLFLFLSPAYFQTMASPASLIELDRRQRAGLELDLLSFARHCARLEGHRSETVEDLQGAGLLPNYFGRRVDGSQPLIVDGELRDSLRGARGTFLPIADVEVGSVTAQEKDAYDEAVKRLSTRGGPVDPLVVAIQRTPRDQDDRERLTLEARLSPFQESRYARVFSVLGPPVGERVVLPADSVISVQAAVQGGAFAGLVPPHQMFLGVYDLPGPVPTRGQGILKFLGYLDYLRSTPGFLGTWPKAGFLDLLPMALAPPPDPEGFSRLPLGLWRWQQSGYSVLSFDQGLLRHAAPQLQPELTDNPAQVRIRIGDLGTTNLAYLAHRAAYDRAAEGVASHLELMNTLTQQLGTPPHQGREMAEQFVRGALRCPTGGEYQLTDVGMETQIWRSTAWPNASLEEMASGYRTKILDWCRGLSADLTKEPDRLQLHAEIDVKRLPPPRTSTNGLLDLLRGAAPRDANSPPPEPQELPAPKPKRREF